MKKSKTIRLYAVFCGLWTQESMFPPFANLNGRNGEWMASLNEATKIYDSITPESFDKKEVLRYRLQGLNTYLRYISVCEMPVELYKEAMQAEQDGAVGYLNEMVYEDSVKHLDWKREQFFELKGHPMELVAVKKSKAKLVA